jgi:hypothetical protein
MANELSTHFSSTGSTLYAIILDVVTGKMVKASDGSLIVASNANYAAAAVAMSDSVLNYQYVANVPGGTPAGEYAYQVYLQGGGSPAAGDTLVAEGEILWSGSAAVSHATSSGTSGSSNGGVVIARIVTLDIADDGTVADRTYTGRRHPEDRIQTDVTNSNSMDNPTVATYIAREQAAGRSVLRQDRNHLITR